MPVTYRVSIENRCYFTLGHFVYDESSACAHYKFKRAISHPDNTSAGNELLAERGLVSFSLLNPAVSCLRSALKSELDQAVIFEGKETSIRAVLKEWDEEVAIKERAEKLKREGSTLPVPV